jgi:hypothetical protein
MTIKNQSKYTGTHPRGGIAVGGPPPQKNEENCGKIAVFYNGNCGRDFEKLRFPNSGQGKGATKIGPSQNLAENFSHICGQFSQILLTNGF